MSHQKSFYSHFILLYNHCSHWSWTNMCRRTMFLDQALPLIPGSKQFEKKLQAVWKLSINTFSYNSALCSTGREISFHPSWQIIKASTMKLKWMESREKVFGRWHTQQISNVFSKFSLNTYTEQFKYTRLKTKLPKL